MIPGSEISLGEVNGTHSSVLAWRTPWIEQSGGYSPWGRKESDTTEQLTHTHMLQKNIYIIFHILYLMLRRD